MHGIGIYECGGRGGGRVVSQGVWEHVPGGQWVQQVVVMANTTSTHSTRLCVCVCGVASSDPN